MSYSSVHRANQTFELGVMGILVVAGLAAIVLMFVHPTGAVIVFLSALVFTLLAWIVITFFRRAERAAAREALAQHQCPFCGATVHEDAQEGGAWRCDACHASFLATGQVCL